MVNFDYIRRYERWKEDSEYESPKQPPQPLKNSRVEESPSNSREEKKMKNKADKNI